MVFADAAFYEEAYLAGRAGIIPPEEFAFWARSASDRINWRRVEIAQEDVPDALRLCTCEVAESLFLESERKFLAMQPSQSVGEYSKGAMSAQRKPGDTDAEITEIIRRHLAFTPLHNDFVFRGG